MAASSLLIPYGITIILIIICLTDKGGKYDLSYPIEVNTLLLVALIIHGLYFVALPFQYELLIDSMPGPLFPKKWSFGKVPDKPDNLFWQLTCLSAELFFIVSIILFLMATQDYVQRLLLFVPIAQCSYNIKHDITWGLLGNLCSPIYERMRFIALDVVIITPLFIIYIIVFFTS